MSASPSRDNKPTVLFWGAQPLPVHSVSVDIDISHNISSTVDQMTASQEPTRVAKLSFDINGELCEHFDTPGTELRVCIVAEPVHRWMIEDAIVQTINHSQLIDGRSELSISIEGVLKKHWK
jgi:hypothetical protein